MTQLDVDEVAGPAVGKLADRRDPHSAAAELAADLGEEFRVASAHFADGAGAVAARQQFLECHGATIYRQVTDDLTSRPGLHAITDHVARRYRGLVPSTMDLAAEVGIGQQQRSGREADLGPLFWSVLRDQECGDHLVRTLAMPTERALRLLPGFQESGTVDLGKARLERVDGVGYLTLDNPQYLNAEDDTVVEALETAVDLVLLDDQISVGVLRGAPMTHPRYAGRRVFSAGINLTHLHEGRISFLDFLLRRELGYINKIYQGLCPPFGQSKPWVAVIESFAIGGGMQLALVFDHVIAETQSYFSLPALQEGIIPGAANLRLHRLLGNRLSRSVILSGRQIQATEDDAQLLVDDVVASADVQDALAVATDRLANPAVVANRRMLHLGEEPAHLFRTYMAEYAREQSQRLYSDDLMENLRRTWISRRR